MNKLTKVVLFSVVASFLIKFFWITVVCIILYMLGYIITGILEARYDNKINNKWGKS